jgi:hypothetical protein
VVPLEPVIKGDFSVMSSLQAVKSPFTKGLLKPFKGKGELKVLLSQLEHDQGYLEQEAVNLCNSAVTQGRMVGLSLRKMRQNTGVKGLTLHWRDMSTHGVGAEKFKQALENCKLSAVKREMLVLEEQRILFNARSKMMHYLVRNFEKTCEEIDGLQKLIES